MKQIWTSLKKQQHYLLFLGILLIIGLATGIFLGIQNKETLLNILPNYISELKNTPINFITSHIIIISVICILSYLFIGIPLACIYLFYEGASIGFLGVGLFSLFGLKAIPFILIFFLLTKAMFLCLYLLLFIKNLRIAKTVMQSIVRKKAEKEQIYSLLQNTLIFLVLILINDILIYFIGSNLIKTIISILQLA